MNILIDLIDTQGMYKGSGIYIRKVFLSLLNFVERNAQYGYVHFICVYDSSKEILYSDFTPEHLSANSRITLVDINGTSFKDICERHSVDTMFLGFGQQIYNYDFTGVNCRVICVLHDIFNLEFQNTKLDEYINLFKVHHIPLRKLLRNWWRTKRNLPIEYNFVNPYQKHIDFFRQNDNYEIVTVSTFSYYSLINLLPFPSEKIHVLWSPEKEYQQTEVIENIELKNLIDSHRKYLLVVSANRDLKNPHRVVDAFKLYKINHPESDLCLLTVGYQDTKCKDHIVLPYLNDADIEHAYRHCYALVYPTYFEGFGYPPVEVMRYSKPVLSSNVCSMPEILEDAPIWFSPFYTTDIYKAIDVLMKSDYEDLCEKAYIQYKKIHKRQEEDLEKLIKLILQK